MGSARELRDQKRRWSLVAARQHAEAQAATLEQELHEVEQLLLSVDDFGWRQALQDDELVRARWNRLRERLGVTGTRRRVAIAAAQAWLDEQGAPGGIAASLLGRPNFRA